MPNVKDLILLVGSSPLPNYVASRAFDADTVYLVFTAETRSVKDDLASQLKKDSPKLKTVDVELRDAAQPQMIRHDVQGWNIPKDAHLHYTGGTKAMAVHIHSEWIKKSNGQGSASYLDDRTLKLLFDNGDEEEIDTSHSLTVERMALLHGMTAPVTGWRCGQPPTRQDALEIATCVARSPDLPHRWYTACPDMESVVVPVDFRQLDLPKLSLKGIDSHMLKRDAKVWAGFIRGEWLDFWVKNLCEDAGSLDVQFNVNAFKDGRQFQIDVVALRGHRLYLISCTTDVRVNMCKAKAFEAQVRARQLGGELARSSIVCLLGIGPRGGDQAEMVQNDVRAHWDSPSAPRVFGLRDIREWVNGNPDSLTNWLAC